MQWQYESHVGLYSIKVPVSGGVYLSVDLKSPFPSYQKNGSLVPADLSQYGGPTPQQNVDNFCAGFNHHLSPTDFERMKKEVADILNPSLENIAVPEIEKGVCLMANFSEKEWTYSQHLFYDSIHNKSYRINNRWKNTPEKVVREVVELSSISHIILCRDTFLAMPGLPAKARPLINRIFENLDR